MIKTSFNPVLMLAYHNRQVTPCTQAPEEHHTAYITFVWVPRQHITACLAEEAVKCQKSEAISFSTAKKLSSLQFNGTLKLFTCIQRKAWAYRNSPKSPSSLHCRRHCCLPESPASSLQTTLQATSLNPILRDLPGHLPRHLPGHPDHARDGLVEDDRRAGGRAEELVDHDPGALDEGEQDAAEEGGAGRGGGALAHLEEPAGGGAGDDGVPGVLLLADVDHGAVEGGEEAAPDGEAAADAGSVHADGLGAAEEAGAAGGVVEAPDEVVGGAAHGAHPESAADVVEDAVGAGLPRGLRSPHGRTMRALVLEREWRERERERERESSRVWFWCFVARDA
ncbi:hypothetical protein BT93_L2036 [Corymbia citriodora subsp. variegata]|uniref:Uncharacterized protein n=1 Tax=Corymbia citriodora subsp. variegata TaxID=360336 RepID=A0A8T0CWA3_CORYI|nr:hypothetical protein BT93_L2036 [Corymbia citriodora subsp. variegata]